MQQRAIGFEHQMAHRLHRRRQRTEHGKIEPPCRLRIERIGRGPTVFELDDGVAQRRDHGAKFGGAGIDAQHGRVIGRGEQRIGGIVDEHELVIGLARAQPALQILQGHDIVGYAAITRIVRQLRQHGGLFLRQRAAAFAQIDKVRGVFGCRRRFGDDTIDLGFVADQVARQRQRLAEQPGGGIAAPRQFARQHRLGLRDAGADKNLADIEEIGAALLPGLPLRWLSSTK